MTFSVNRFLDRVFHSETSRDTQTSESASPVTEDVASSSNLPSRPGAGIGAPAHRRFWPHIGRKSGNTPSADRKRSEPSPESSRAAEARKPAQKSQACPKGSSARDGRRAAFINKFHLQHLAPLGKSPETVELTGNDLTEEKLIAIARRGALVSVSPDAMENVSRGFEVVMQAARQKKPVYGLTTGVGQNKDKKVLGQGKALVSEEEKFEQMLEASRKFNLSSVRAHTSGTGKPISKEIVRAALAIRLNTLLSGAGGVQPAVVEALKDFLNNDITPLIPDTGSIGQADLLLMSHVGLAMVGEWYVLPSGDTPSENDLTDAELRKIGLTREDLAPPKRVMRTRHALAEEGLDPVELVGKDFLAIMSNNSVTAGSAALGLHDAGRFLMEEIQLFALCLQGLNGNIAPFMEASTEKARPFPQQTAMAKAIRDVLQDSRLWKTDPERPMQDPISYRTVHNRLGTVSKELLSAKEALEIQLNSSDDNPFVDIDHRPGTSPQEQSYVVEMPNGKAGAIIPTGNFDSSPFTDPIDNVLLGFRKLADAMNAHPLRFESPEIFKTPDGIPRRFLAAGEGHAFGAVSKGLEGLMHDIKQVAQPADATNVPVAGGQVEDINNAGARSVKNLNELIPLMYKLGAYSIMYGTQAVDLRGEVSELSPATQELHMQYREEVPFFEDDRESTTALAQGAYLLRNRTSGMTE